MDDSTWERRGSWGGILFVVLSVVSAGLPGEPAKTSDTIGDITTFVNDKGKELRWAAFVGGLAVIALLWWLGSVWRFLRRAEGGEPLLTVVAVAAAVFSAAMITVGGVMLAATPIVDLGVNSPVSTRTLYVIATNLGIATVFGMATFLLAFCVVIIRRRVLPVWLGWAGVVIAIVAVFGGGGVSSTRDIFFFGSFAGFVGVLLWVLVVSILMLRGAGAEVDAAGASATTPSAT